MKAKKSLGQNFLRSDKTIETMVNTGNPKEGEMVIEIGPGEGVMTRKILDRGVDLVAIEADKDLISVLEQRFEKEIHLGQLTLIYGDVLNSEKLDEITKKHKYKIIANIPYYITGQILRKFLEAGHKPESMTLLIQKEVAERIVAKDKKESLLSISVKLFGQPKYIKTISRAFFSPQPKVDSAILTIENISSPKLESGHENGLFNLIRLGFGHKRKQLVSNLSEKYNRENILWALVQLNLNPKVRAENLSVENWLNLYNIILNQQ